MNGDVATALIRELGFPRLIFGISGNALDDDVVRFHNAGADCVIAKPFRASQLDAIMQHTQAHGTASVPKAKYHMVRSAGDKFVLRPKG